MNNGVCKYILTLTTLFWGLCSGCLVTNNKITEIISNEPIPNKLSRRFDAAWEITENPIIECDDNRFVVHAIILDYFGATIIYSLLGSDESIASFLERDLAIRDNKGRVSRLVSDSILNDLNNVAIGTMNFDLRYVESSELFLQANQVLIQQGCSDTRLAVFSAPMEDQTLLGRRTYLSNTSGNFKQNNYQISFAGWWESPLFVNTNVPKLPEGVDVRRKATLQIEDTTTDSIFFLYIQFLSNGEQRGFLLE